MRHKIHCHILPATTFFLSPVPLLYSRPANQSTHSVAAIWRQVTDIANP